MVRPFSSISRSRKKADGFSVVDRTGTTYEIGDAASSEAYKTWLRNSIGSGYYYDSTDMTGLQKAYEEIFAKIRDFNEITAEASVGSQRSAALLWHGFPR